MAVEPDITNLNQQALLALECDICNEEYGEDFNHVPRVLRCGHTHCTRCLMKMLTAKGVQCPICMQMHPLAYPDITQLPINMTLFELLRTRGEESSQEPDPQKPLCEVCNAFPATMVCVDCVPGVPYKFCQDCDRREHERSFGPVRRHRRYLVDEVPSLMSFVPCSRHSERKADYYSVYHNEFACKACELLSDWPSRAGYFETIELCARNMRGFLKKLNETSGNMITNLSASMMKVKDTLYKLEPAASNAKANISNQFSEIISKIQSRQANLVKQVDMECADRTHCLEQQVVQIEQASQSLRKAHQEAITVMSLGDYEFLKSYRNIQRSMEALILSEDRSLLTPLTTHNIPLIMSQEVVQKLTTLGAVCGGRAPIELIAEPRHDLLRLSWVMPEKSEAKSFEVEFEQTQTELAAVMKHYGDQHHFSQKEPQYQRVAGADLYTYVDFLCPGYTYKFKVRSLNDAGWGMWSDSITASCINFPVEFEYTKRIHRICVPISAYYRITARGAKAVDGHSRKGGRGAIISAIFSLKQGDILIFLCGGMSQTHEYSSGGGGGTFVALNDISPENLLIVAGGGGGTRGRDDNDFDGDDASLDTHGTNGKGTEHGMGGQGGEPGEDADSIVFRGPCWGYGGAGALKDSKTASSFLGGGGGGRNGGFGGGGGAGSWGGGGGGGYSGGGGGRGGGGGGSYIRGDAIDIKKEVGNEENGSVLIEKADPPYPESDRGYCTSEHSGLQRNVSSTSSVSAGRPLTMMTSQQSASDITLAPMLPSQESVTNFATNEHVGNLVAIDEGQTATNIPFNEPASFLQMIPTTPSPDSHTGNHHVSPASTGSQGNLLPVNEFHTMTLQPELEACPPAFDYDNIGYRFPPNNGAQPNYGKES